MSHDPPPPVAASLPGPPQRLFLPALTAQRLREAVHAGVWAAQGRLPGERELAQHMQVCRQTVRAALRLLGEDKLFAEEARKRRRLVHAVPPARVLPVSRVVRLLSSRTVGELAPSLLLVIGRLREALNQAGWSLDIHHAAPGSRGLAALTARLPAAAWLLVGTLQPVQAWFERSSLPCLVIGTCASGLALPSIDTGYRATCQHAGAMLLRKGHKHVALIRPEAALGGEAETEEGLRRAMETKGGRLTVVRHRGTPSHLCQSLAALMKPASRPTAWVISRAEHVVTAMMFAQSQGWKIPQDVAVVSRDDEVFLAHTVPEVTRYARHDADFARRLFRVTRQLAETGQLPVTPVRLIPRLIQGATC